MAQKRLSVRKIRGALRLRHECGRSSREIASSLNIAHSTARESCGGPRTRCFMAVQADQICVKLEVSWTEVTSKAICDYPRRCAVCL